MERRKFTREFKLEAAKADQEAWISYAQASAEGSRDEDPKSDKAERFRIVTV
jgi:hypothetical protein